MQKTMNNNNHSTQQQKPATAGQPQQRVSFGETIDNQLMADLLNQKCYVAFLDGKALIGQLLANGRYLVCVQRGEERYIVHKHAIKHLRLARPGEE